MCVHLLFFSATHASHIRNTTRNELDRTRIVLKDFSLFSFFWFFLLICTVLHRFFQLMLMAVKGSEKKTFHALCQVIWAGVQLAIVVIVYANFKGEKMVPRQILCLQKESGKWKMQCFHYLFAEGSKKIVWKWWMKCNLDISSLQ